MVRLCSRVEANVAYPSHKFGWQSVSAPAAHVPSVGLVHLTQSRLCWPLPSWWAPAMHSHSPHTSSGGPSTTPSKPLAGATISAPQATQRRSAHQPRCACMLLTCCACKGKLVMAHWCRENVIANTRAMQQRAWQQVAAEHSLPWTAGERNIYDIRPERAITEGSLPAAFSGTSWARLPS